jgi:hypothetical protein
MAVVPPTHVEKGASPKKCSDSTTRKRTPREVTPPLADLQPPPRPQKHSDDRRRDTLAKDGAYIQSRGRSETRRRGTSRTETPSHSQEDLRDVIGRLNANKSCLGSKRRNQRCKHCGANEFHGFRACPAADVECLTCGMKGHLKSVCYTGLELARVPRVPGTRRNSEHHLWHPRILRFLILTGTRRAHSM